MKCPKCNEEIIDGIKFCTKCGANIEEEKKRIADEETKKQEEAEKKRKAAEDKKRLEEIRKQEQLKKEQEIKEAEKQAAIRQAKEEGIELEIIDEAPKIEKDSTDNTSDFKIKKQEDVKSKSEKKKKQKVKIKKNIFQRILNKIIFMIIVAALIIGGVYYCYTQEILPDFAQKEVEEFESKLKNVIQLYKEVKDEEKDSSEQSKVNKEENWSVDPTIEATDIKDLTKEVSVIIKNDKAGIIENNTGKIVVEPTYTQILYTEYYDLDKSENEKQTGIIVQEDDKFFKVDKEYQKKEEVRTIAKKDEGTYFYEHHRDNIYYNSADQKCTKIKEDSTKTGLKVCTDIDLVTTDGIAATSINMPENFSIDFSKSKITTKGYFDLATGKLKINCDYDEAYEFSEGYAVIEKEIKSQYSTSEVYDTEGNEISTLSKQTLSGIIDENGKEVVEAKYEEIRSVHNRKAFAMKNGKWGILEIK